MVKKRKPNAPNKTGFLIMQVLAELPVCCPDIYDLLGEQVNVAPSPSWHHSGLASLSPECWYSWIPDHMTIPKSTATSRSYLLSLQAIALFPSEETHILFALTAPEDMAHNNPQKPIKAKTGACYDQSLHAWSSSL